MSPMLLREMSELFIVEASHEAYLTPCARLSHHEIDPSDEDRAHLHAESARIAERAFVEELVTADEDSEREEG